MLRRFILQDWSTTCAILAFLFTAGVFAYVTWRAIRISPERRKQLAAIPLDSSPPSGS